MGFSKSSSKRKVYSNTILPQEARKTSNRQPNFTPKTTGKRRKTTTTKKISRRKEIINIQAEINEKEMKEIVKINKTKSWFFEKINKIDKSLARLIKKKREKNQINKIINEKGEVTTDNAEIQRIIRNYYKQLYGKNLEEMNRFLEKFHLLRLSQEEIEIMHNPITSTEIEAMIKNLP